jgi:hypothetical protein
MNKRITHLSGRESKILRLAAFLIGCIGLAVLIFTPVLEDLPIHSQVAAYVLSTMFAIYGAGGSKLLFKLVPTTYVRKL